MLKQFEKKIYMETIDINKAKTHFSQLLSRVNAGEEIIISKAGKPYARLVPFKKLSKRIPGIAKGKVTEAFFDPLPEDELAKWE
jgi:prevent-host-death family protein